MRFQGDFNENFMRILCGFNKNMTIWGMLTLKEKQRISRALPARFSRIKQVFYTVFCSFRRLGRGRPDGHRTCAGNAFVLSFACVCCLFCLF